MKIPPARVGLKDLNAEAAPARRSVLLALGASLGLIVSGCVVYPTGPAPYAPANGYRWYHPDGYWLAYDAGLGLYVVVGWPYYYYWDGVFFRYYSGRWYRSRHLRARSWTPWPHARLPPRLRRYRTSPPWRVPTAPSQRPRPAQRERRPEPRRPGPEPRRPGSEPRRPGPESRRPGPELRQPQSRFPRPQERDLREGRRTPQPVEPRQGQRFEPRAGRTPQPYEPRGEYRRPGGSTARPESRPGQAVAPSRPMPGPQGGRTPQPIHPRERNQGPQSMPRQGLPSGSRPVIEPERGRGRMPWENR